MNNQNDLDIGHDYLLLIMEAAKKIFFSGPTTKALPPPLEFSGHLFIRNFLFKIFKKSYFSLMVRPLPPPPFLSGRTTSKTLFLRLPKAADALL